MRKERKELLDKLLSDDIWFCPKVFNNIYTNVSGEYFVCCVGANPPKQPLVNYKNTTPIEWFTSDKMNAIRKDMLSVDNNKSELIQDHCRSCIQQEKEHGVSDRIMEQRNLYDSPESLDQIQDFIDKGKYEFKNRVLIMQMRIFGNTCNLDCYMCTPDNSSIRSSVSKKHNYEKLISFGEPNLIATSKGSAGDYSMRDLVILSPYVRSIILQGGEPLVMTEQYKFLDKVIETGQAHHINIEMNSNLVTLKAANKHNFLNYVSKFHTVYISASIDGYGIYNDYIRRRSDWEGIVDNVRTLRKYNNIKMQIFSTVSLLSILRFDELQNWAMEEGLNLQPYILTIPSELHMKNLPDALKEELLIRHEGEESIVKALSLPRDEEEYIKAIKYIQKTDEVYRGTKHHGELFEIFPELKR